MAALVSDDRIPNEINNLRQALNIANNRLVEKYGASQGSPTKIATREGSSNTVDVYRSNYGGKEITYAVRMGKDPAFIVEASHYQTARITVIPEYNASYMQTTKEKFLQETQDSERNWKLADEKGLSPELYFYGYIRQGKNLVLCTISEAFNMDLEGFIRDHGFGNEEMQQNIVTQLITLFKEMAKDMSMICFDIKPQNTVIKFDQDAQGAPILNENFIIKLIDWDADWCRDYKFLRGRDQVASVANQKAAATIMIMVMANFFYHYYNFNILSDYMKAFYNEEGDTFTTTKVMMNLFEAGFLNGVNTTEFAFMARHYFRMDFQDNYEKFLTEMFKRSMCKDRDEYQSNSDSINITLRGGKKNKKKTRRKRKRKYKSKKTNKKIKKTRSKTKRKRKTKKRN